MGVKSHHTDTGAIGSQSEKDDIAESRITRIARNDIDRLGKHGEHKDIGQVAQPIQIQKKRAADQKNPHPYI